jgi:hypothetical protein
MYAVSIMSNTAHSPPPFHHTYNYTTALSLPLGKTTVMHMIVRDRLPEEQNTESTRVRTKVVTADHQAQSSCCTIL